MRFFYPLIVSLFFFSLIKADLFDEIKKIIDHAADLISSRGETHESDKIKEDVKTLGSLFLQDENIAPFIKSFDILLNQNQITTESVSDFIGNLTIFFNQFLLSDTVTKLMEISNSISDKVLITHDIYDSIFGEAQKTVGFKLDNLFPQFSNIFTKGILMDKLFNLHLAINNFFSGIDELIFGKTKDVDFSKPFNPKLGEVVTISNNVLVLNIDGSKVLTTLNTVPTTSVKETAFNVEETGSKKGKTSSATSLQLSPNLHIYAAFFPFIYLFCVLI